MPRRYAISDSTSESESDQPLASAPSGPTKEGLEKALRDAVAQIYHSGNMEDLTVKRVRAAAERSMGLDEGYFKGDAEWKAKSDRIIKDEVAVQDRIAQEEDEDEKQDEKPAPPTPEPAKTTKRPNGEDAAKARKRRKTSSPESDYESPYVSEESEEDTKATKKSGAASKKAQQKLSEDLVPEDSDFEEEIKKPTKRSKQKLEKPKPELSNDRIADDSDAEEEEETKPSKPSEGAQDQDSSESEMSVVIDEPPKPSRKRQKSSEPPSGKPKKKGKGKDTDLDPDQEEIKRLQGWLIKCGIRKMWARELAPYGTPKAKIKHLKDMLKDAGMEGRYSVEKAKRIREERELKADLEMVQEGAKRWGRGADEGSEEERPRRRQAQVRKSLAFLESDGEETD